MPRKKGGGGVLLVRTLPRVVHPDVPATARSPAKEPSSATPGPGPGGAVRCGRLSFTPHHMYGTDPDTCPNPLAVTTGQPTPATPCPNPTNTPNTMKTRIPKTP